MKLWAIRIVPFLALVMWKKLTLLYGTDGEKVGIFRIQTKKMGRKIACDYVPFTIQ